MPGWGSWRCSRGPRLSGPRQVCDPGVAHPAGRGGRPTRCRVDGVAAIPAAGDDSIPGDSASGNLQLRYLASGRPAGRRCEDAGAVLGGCGRRELRASGPFPAHSAERAARPGAAGHPRPDRAGTVEDARAQPKLIEALSTVYDPEIPVNIYELGLIYDVDVNADGLVGIRMTLTSPGCPAAQTLPVEVKAKARAVPGVSDAWVDVVWEPQWDMNKMSDAAKLQLGLL